MLNLFRASGQSLTGILHFLLILFIAKYKILNADSSLGNTRLFLITFLMVEFTDSIELVVYKILRISLGWLKNVGKYVLSQPT